MNRAFRRRAARRAPKSARNLALGFLAGYLPIYGLSAAPTAQAYLAVADLPQTTIHYRIGADVTAAMGGNVGVESGGAAWNADSRNELYFDHNETLGLQYDNRLFMSDIDGPGHFAAFASTPCNGSNCDMWFDRAENWYGGTGTPGAGQTDAWSISAHEFGHWVGLNHTNGQVPSTDTSAPKARAALMERYVKAIILGMETR